MSLVPTCLMIVSRNHLFMRPISVNANRFLRNL